MKLVVFAASSSRQSINKKLAVYSASFLDCESVEVLDLNDYELPLYSEDKEKEMGQPEQAKKFLAVIGDADALIISFAEHNGSYTAAYKNIFDWCSRTNPKVYQNKPMVILSTSPGPGGASNVLATAKNSMQYFDGVVKGSFSLSSFYENFDIENNVISSEELQVKLRREVEKLST